MKCEKIIEVKKPKYLLLENVKKNLVGKKFKPDFDKWLNYLEGLGYKKLLEGFKCQRLWSSTKQRKSLFVSILEDNKGYIPRS